MYCDNQERKTLRDKNSEEPSFLDSYCEMNKKIIRATRTCKMIPDAKKVQKVGENWNNTPKPVI